MYAADNAAAAINKRSRLDQTASPVRQKSSASEPRHPGVAAVQLAYQRFPGRVVGIDETPPADVLSFVAGQLSIEPGIFHEYACREETRWEHLGKIQAYLRVRPFSRGVYRSVAKIATTEAIGTDRGDVIVAVMIEMLRTRGILLPAPTILERIGLAARARKQAHKNLAEGLEQRTIAALEAFDHGRDTRDRTATRVAS